MLPHPQKANFKKRVILFLRSWHTLLEKVKVFRIPPIYLYERPGLRHVLSTRLSTNGGYHLKKKHP